MSDSENGKGDNETTQPDVKEEDNEDQKESTDSKQEEKSTNEEKKPKKTTKKEEVKEDDDDEDDGSDDSEEEVGLLDRPVEVSGSRERKKVERLEVNFKTHTNKAKIAEGRGEKLGECPRIEFKIQKTPVEELKVLHKLLFNRPGSAHEIKRNIRKFSGFSFVEGSAEFEKKKSALEKQKMGVLKQICEVLDVERSGVREDLALRIVQFLLEPKSSGKQVPSAKSKKRTSTKGGKAKRTEKEKKSKKGSAKKRKKASDSDEEGEGSEESEKEEEEEEEEEDEEEEEVADDSDGSFEEPKKKKKSKPRKKKETPAKEKKKEKNGEKSKKSEDKKTPAKTAKRKSVGSSDDSDDESSDGEPLAKKVKSPPSDDEIKQLVKKILDDADLEEITMKKVIKQVFDTYPDFDLSEKKDYIKATVKSVIS